MRRLRPALTAGFAAPLGFWIRGPGRLLAVHRLGFPVPTQHPTLRGVRRPSRRGSVVRVAARLALGSAAGRGPSLSRRGSRPRTPGYFRRRPDRGPRGVCAAGRPLVQPWPETRTGLWLSESLCGAAQGRQPQPSLVQRLGAGPGFARVQGAHLNVPGPPTSAGLSVLPASVGPLAP